MPFVFKKRGKYLRYSENTTHTGTHRLVEWVERLQDATVGVYLPLSLRKELQDAERVEVVETRTVVLKSEAAGLAEHDARDPYSNARNGLYGPEVAGQFTHEE